MELNLLLRRAVELGASDIHLKVGVPPILRRDGSLGPLEEAPVVTDSDTEAVLAAVGKRSPERYEAFKTTGDLDIAYQEEDLPRFRVNAFRQRGDISFAFRVIPAQIPDFRGLGLPPGVEKLSATAYKYRVRQGDYRIVYELDEKARSVLIVKIGHRKDVYRRR